LNGASSIAYVNLAHKALTQYSTPAKMFSNVHAADCGGFTKCYLKPKGCVGTYEGKQTVDATTFGLKVKQEETLGYTENLCVVCENLAGSKAKKDNWEVHQIMNCAVALSG